MRLPGEGNSNSRGARPAHQVISIIEWIWTSRSSKKNSLSLEEGAPFGGDGPLIEAELDPLAAQRVHRHILAFGVQGSGLRDQGSGFRVQGSGFRAQGSGRRVQSSGFRVQGSGFRVQGSGCRVRRDITPPP
jgi:hypothetical protein